MDQGHKETDELLEKIEQKIRKQYAQAAKELTAKLEKHLKQFEADDKMMLSKLDAGDITDAEYYHWRTSRIMMGKHWEQMRDQLAEDLVHSHQMADSVVNSYLPEVYALNHNYGTYQIEHDSQMSTSYTLYNRQAVERLLRDDPDLLPQPKVNIPKAERWNKQHIQSSVLQGVLQGESMDKIARRMRDVCGMDARAAIRNARTATTGAENAGRLDSMNRALGMGIGLKKLWLATRDSRTRDSHVLLDGELREVNEKFSNGCMHPGDPHGRPEEVYNCRCAMRSKVEGADPYSPDLSRNQRLGGMSYEQWKEQARERVNSKSASEKYLSLNDTIKNLQGTIENSSKMQNQDLVAKKSSTVKRPDNESPFLRDFDYIGVPEDGTDIYKSINPNFKKEEGYDNNCVRCIGAEEMKWRGYDVEAMPYNENDPVKQDGGSFWDGFDMSRWYKDPYGFENFETPDKVVNVLRNAFTKWGDGARAMMAVRWNDNTNHALFVRREGGKIIFEDTQSGKIVDPMNIISQLSTEINTSFIMRIDNRPFNENVKYIAQNRVSK